MDDVKAKQQIVEKIQSSTNILVTVSNSPTVDELSAAIGLTLLLDKLEKNTTTIFSGATPPAIEFLEPEKTFDDTTDSLRDFIVALNKEKADHLRYKVEGDLVKIYITPYKTKISQEDLEFSQGDYNVELVIALGVSNQGELDNALDSHGQILHDATIITVTAGDQTSTLGGIDWHDGQTGSLSEMVAGLVEALKTDPNAPLVDAPMATALLTGIVAETDRFSNTSTTARTMSVAAQLMAGGADQQLIASKLQESHEIGVQPTLPTPDSSEQPQTLAGDGLSIEHQPGETLADIEKRVGADKPTETSLAAEPVQAEAVTPTPIVPTGKIADAYALDVEDQQALETPSPAPVIEPTPAPAIVEPTAPSIPEPTAPVEEPAPVAEPSASGRSLITRSYLSPLSEDGLPAPELNPAYGPDPNEVSQQPTQPEQIAPASISEPVVPEAPVAEAPTLPDVSLDDDAALAAALAAPAQPVQPIVPPATPSVATPSGLGLPMPPPLPDFSALSGQAPQMPATPADNLPAGPSEALLAPAAPDPISAIGQSAPVTSPEPAPAIQPIIPPVPTNNEPGLNDPGQFQIPTPATAQNQTTV